jgi:hypothetical protein
VRDVVVASVSRRTFLAGALVALAGCAGGRSALRSANILPVSPAEMPDQVSAPTLRTGDWWAYIQRDQLTGLETNRGRFHVTRVTDAGYQIREEWQQGGVVTAFYNRDLNPVRTYNLSFTPAFPRFSFPLFIGKSWQADVVRSDVPPKQFGTLRQQVNGSVGGWDRITVPAGTFTAVRIDLTIVWRDTDAASARGSSRETVWYVPTINAIALSRREDFYGDFQVINDSILELAGIGTA